MWVFVVIAIFIAAAAGVYLGLYWKEREQKRKSMSQLLYRFSQLGTKHNLAFSSHELLKGYIIGVDGLHRKLLIQAVREGNKYHHFLIDLNDVSHCRVKKVYKVLHINKLKEQNSKHNVEKLVLLFEMSHDLPSVEIPFYRHTENHPWQLYKLEQKARDWEVMLSKMLHCPTEEKKHLG